MYQVDLNSDLGESFGAYTIGLDQDVIAMSPPPILPVGIMQAIRW